MRDKSDEAMRLGFAWMAGESAANSHKSFPPDEGRAGRIAALNFREGTTEYFAFLAAYQLGIRKAGQTTMEEETTRPVFGPDGEYQGEVEEEEQEESATEGCYYHQDNCSGPLWECNSCGESFCSGVHDHHTDKGQNVECIACERERNNA